MIVDVSHGRLLLGRVSFARACLGPCVKQETDRKRERERERASERSRTRFLLISHIQCCKCVAICRAGLKRGGLGGILVALGASAVAICRAVCHEGLEETGARIEGDETRIRHRILTTPL